MSGFAVVLLLIAAFIAIAVCGHLQAEKRKKELAQWAANHGFSFSSDQDRGFDDRYPEFSCLARGDSRYAYNIMRGKAGDNAALAFDYHYVTHSTDSKGRRTTHHHHFSAVIVAPPFPLKSLSIRTENIFDKIGGFLGFPDIELESAEFNREFHVASPDRRWAFDVLNQQAMEFLLESRRFSLDMYDGCLIAYDDSVFSPQEFAAALAVTTGLLARLPTCVVQELQEPRE